MIAHTVLGQEFHEAFDRLQTRVPDAEVGSLLADGLRAADVGAGMERSQRALAKLLNGQRQSRLQGTLAAADLGDPLAYAYFSRLGSVSANAIFRAWPGQQAARDLSAREFVVIMQRQFGQPLSVLRDIVGNSIGTLNAVVDPLGRALSAAKLPGDSNRHRHDAVRDEFITISKAYKVQCSHEPRRLFRDLLSADVLRNEDNPGHKIGIVPDIELDLQLAKTVIGDIKTIGDVSSYAQRVAAKRSEKQRGARQRQAAVHSEYPRKANMIDRKQGHGDPSLANVKDTPMSWYQEEAHWGPVRRRLDEFKLLGLVAGPRGELSSDFVSAVTQIAAIGAMRIGNQVPVASGTQVSTILRWHALCRLGKAAQRASAQHLLDRLGYATRGGAQRDAYDTATAATFGPDGPAAVTDSWRDTFYGDAGSATPWSDSGMGSA